MTTNPKPELDVFAQIAAHRSETRRDNLIVPRPPKLPRRFLAATTSDPGAAFRPAGKLDSCEMLDRELPKRRRAHAPFLRDLAPALESHRIVRPLKRFDWRLETVADIGQFDRVLKGRGSWTGVTIPHYGGPIGRQVAYYPETWDQVFNSDSAEKPHRTTRRSSLQSRIRRILEGRDPSRPFRSGFFSGILIRFRFARVPKEILIRHRGSDDG